VKAVEEFSKVQRRGRRPETEVELFGESISPDPRGLQSHEVGDEVTQPQKRGRSLRRNVRFHILRSSEGQRPRTRPRSQDHERRRRHLAVARASFEGSWNPPTRLSRCFLVLGRSHPARRAAVLRVASPESSEEGQVLGLSGLGGSRIRGVKVKALEGQKPRRVSVSR
jgi:hypothetical protein